MKIALSNMIKVTVNLCIDVPALPCNIQQGKQGLYPNIRICNPHFQKSCVYALALK